MAENENEEKGSFYFPRYSGRMQFNAARAVSENRFQTSEVLSEFIQKRRSF
jgi:hypothetical protein